MTLQALPEAVPHPDRALSEGLSVVVHEGLAPAEQAWRRLEQNPLASLHNGFDWSRTWLAANPSPVLVVEGRLGGKPIFLLPLEISKTPLGKNARFIAGDYSNINTGLFAPHLGLIDPRALLAALKPALRSRVDLISLENMPLRWRDTLHPLSLLDRTENQNHAFQMPLLSSFEETLKQVNAKRRRKKYRLQLKKLEEIGGYEIFEPATPPERHALLDEFFRQKAERFQAQGLPDVFREKPVQAFFHALLDLPETETQYALRLLALRLKGAHEGTVLAVAGLSRKGDHVICQFGSIREDLFPETSPGEFLFWHMIEACCATGAALFDFGIGDQLYKRSWCTVETVQYDLLLPLTLRGRLAASTHRAKVRLKAAIKENKAVYGFIQRLRVAKEKAPVTAPDPED